MHRRWLALAALCVSAFALAGCGWHLAGTLPGQTPLGMVRISGERSGTAAVLRESLRVSRGVQLVENDDPAALQIAILADATGRRIVALSGAGRAREFEIVQTVRFNVRFQGQDLIPTDTIEFRSQISYDDSSVLSKEYEIAALVESMQRDAAAQILRRSAALKR
jgi:LPS-assembly lipoprotein